jgi:hypothetical protein
MTSDQLSQLLDTEDAMKAAFDACRKEVQSRIEAGEKVSGYDMCPGKNAKVWNVSEEELVKKLRAMDVPFGDVYQKKLITPAATLKLKSLSSKQKKAIEKELITVMSGKLSLKKVSHSVAQSDTTVVQCVHQMFAGVPSSSPVIATDNVSFF